MVCIAERHFDDLVADVLLVSLSWVNYSTQRASAHLTSTTQSCKLMLNLYQ